MENYLFGVFLVLMVIANIAFVYYWWQAHHYFKHRSFFTFAYGVIYVWNKGKFEQGGLKYRTKAIISLLVALISIIIMINMQK